MTTRPLPDDPAFLRLFPTEVMANNHDIKYRLRRYDGKSKPNGLWYVFEHQTQPCVTSRCGGRFMAGKNDYVSPKDHIGDDNTPNTFVDTIYGGALNTVQSFTISLEQKFNPAAQYKVLIRYGNGLDYSCQRIYQPYSSDPVLINGMRKIPEAPELAGEF